MSWLTDKIGMYIASGLFVLSLAGVLALGFLWKGEQGRADRLDTDINAPKTGYVARLSACQSQVDSLTGSLERQNEAVEQLRVEADERTRRASAAIAAAQREAAVYRTKAERIAKARPGPDQCASARSLIIETLAEEREK